MLALLLLVDQMEYKSTEAAIWSRMTNDYVECCCCLVLVVLDLLEAMHLSYWMPLVQCGLHANNLAENKSVTSSPAQDCYAIV